jgi:DNA repair protein RadC
MRITEYPRWLKSLIYYYAWEVEVNSVNRSNQYNEDCKRLGFLIERYTGIPKERIIQFVSENAASKLMSSSCVICKTDAQRNKLAALFEFTNLYSTIRDAENSRPYIMASSTMAIKYFINYFAGMNDKERFAAAFLDSQNKVILTKVLFEGTVNESQIYPRELIKEALFHNSNAIMLAHNHPGGSLSPSNPDLIVTHKLKEVMESLGIMLMDHIIVADRQAMSLAESGHLEPSKRNACVSKAASPIKESIKAYCANANSTSVKRQLSVAKERLKRRQDTRNYSFSRKLANNKGCQNHR